jgi:cholesterol oxidase
MRAARFVWTCLRHPIVYARSVWIRGASDRGVILLVMQALDNSLTSYRKKGILGPRLMTKQGLGDPNPDWIPIAHDIARRYATQIDGDAYGTYMDVFNVPTTAHYIGGAVIGVDPDHGVIDPYQRLYGYYGLHVIDGSAISANLGVNPSLTITAQAERALAFWPNRGEADPRPPLGGAYVRLSPVQPKHPAVPEAAPGALRLPLVAS